MFDPYYQYREWEPLDGMYPWQSRTWRTFCKWFHDVAVHGLMDKCALMAGRAMKKVVAHGVPEGICQHIQWLVMYPHNKHKLRTPTVSIEVEEEQTVSGKPREGCWGHELKENPVIPTLEAQILAGPWQVERKDPDDDWLWGPSPITTHWLFGHPKAMTLEAPPHMAKMWMYGPMAEADMCGENEELHSLYAP